MVPKLDLVLPNPSIPQPCWFSLSSHLSRHLSFHYFITARHVHLVSAQPTPNSSSLPMAHARVSDFRALPRGASVPGTTNYLTTTAANGQRNRYAGWAGRPAKEARINRPPRRICAKSMMYPSAARKPRRFVPNKPVSDEMPDFWRCGCSDGLT